jgi:hypothetical protein
MLNAGRGALITKYVIAPQQANIASMTQGTLPEVSIRKTIEKMKHSIPFTARRAVTWAPVI